jgi:hypothetical protein
MLNEQAERYPEIMKPKRIQRKRTKGWRMPQNATYVGRPTRWGNPFSIGDFYQITLLSDDPLPKSNGKASGRRAPRHILQKTSLLDLLPL